MDRYLHAFDAAEQARIQGDDAKAVLLYEEAASLAQYSSAADLVALHHMWGLVLIEIGETDEARNHLIIAMNDTRGEEHGSVLKDYSRTYLIDGNLGSAETFIYRAIGRLPMSNLAERGASLGIKARILLAGTERMASPSETEFLLRDYLQDKYLEAFELFGTADVLLQRSENRYYELYNLLYFMEAIIEHCDIYDGDDGARSFLQNQWRRLQALARDYGGAPHRERASIIVAKIFADVEG
jgi:tetratricopeptide (TPR) repeat protein